MPTGLAHRCRLAVLTSYFEHVLQLPLAYHGETHSGRLMKIMLQGTDALWAFWLGFFREHLAAFVSLFLLVPLALFLNWRMAILLIVLCVLFAALTALVLRKTETLQSTVQTHHSDLAERASDALGNIALVHSFVRVELEVTALKSVSERLLAAQYPVLSWWAVATVLTRASTTLAILSIIALGTWLFRKGLITVGEIATFMALAGMVVARLEQAVSFANRMTLDAARLREFFDVLDTIRRDARPARRRRSRPLNRSSRIRQCLICLRWHTSDSFRPELYRPPGGDGGPCRRDRCRQVDRAHVAASRLRSAIRMYPDRRNRRARYSAWRA